MQITVSINPSICCKFPMFRRGIVVAENINNVGTRAKLESLLQSAIQQAQREPIDIASDESSLLWKQAHQEFGSNPNRFPPSHLAMRKRVQAGKSIPSINPVVAIMNYNSLLAHTSVGGDDVDHVGDQLELRIADGSETFVPLFKDTVQEHPELGEVIYADDADQVMCRRWNWRNSHVSRIRDETTNMVMNIDGLGDDCEQMVVRTRDKVADMLHEFCNANVTTALLQPNAPAFSHQATLSHVS